MNLFNRKSPPAIRSLVGEGTSVSGDLRFQGGLRIDGEVRGDVIAADGERSLLVVSENARIHGKVKADHVIINGEVAGPIESRELLELQPKARVTGDVRYEMIEMHPGATIDGELRAMRSQERPALKLAASNDA